MRIWVSRSWKFWVRRDSMNAARSAGPSLSLYPSQTDALGSCTKEDRCCSGGKLRVTSSDRLRATLHIPSTKPDVLIPIHTKSSRERYLVGEWFASIVEAGRGDFSRLNQFPKGIYIDGVRLPTGAYEVHKILEAMENSESPFERLYASAGAT
jgi:hypothetical protein